MSISPIGQINPSMMQNSTNPSAEETTRTQSNSTQNNKDSVTLSNASQEELAKALATEAAKKENTVPPWMKDSTPPSTLPSGNLMIAAIDETRKWMQQLMLMAKLPKQSKTQ